MSIIRRTLVTGILGSLALASLTACGPEQKAAPSQGSTTAATSAPASSQWPRQQTPAQTTAAPAASTSSATRAPVDQLVSVNSVINYEGIGAYRLGTPGKELERQGLATPSGACEKMWDPTKTPRVLGIEMNFDGDGRLVGVSTMNPMMKTTSEAHAGMTFAEVAKIYGTGFSYVSKPLGEQGATLKVGRISHGGREILFGHRADSGQDTDATPEGEVSWVMVQEQSKGIFWGC